MPDMRSMGIAILNLNSGGGILASEIKRMRFYDGLFLKQDEFKLEQNYHRRLHRLHNYYLHTHGIVSGLKITIGNTDNTILVKAGIALDRCFDAENEEFISREIFLAGDTEINLIGENGYTVGDSAYVWVTYEERVTDLDTSCGPEPKHWIERAVIGHSKTKPTHQEEQLKIILGKVNITEHNRINAENIVEIEPNGDSLRVYAGFCSKELATDVLILKDDAIPSKWAYLDGKLFFGSKNGINVKSEHTNFTGDVSIDGVLTGNIKKANNPSAIDLSFANVIYLDCREANIGGSITVLNGVPGTIYYLIVKSNGIYYKFTNIKWPSGIDPIPSADGKRDMYCFICVAPNDYLGTFAFNYT
ncbi:MAG: hypothetical protein QG657_5108 [Acidobacteriota bacterium]|nr:hypothetical protein [Acidobacteriota bacterium]